MGNIETNKQNKVYGRNEKFERNRSHSPINYKSSNSQNKVLVNLSTIKTTNQEIMSTEPNQNQKQFKDLFREYKTKKILSRNKISRNMMLNLALNISSNVIQNSSQRNIGCNTSNLFLPFPIMNIITSKSSNASNNDDEIVVNDYINNFSNRTTENLLMNSSSTLNNYNNINPKPIPEEVFQINKNSNDEYENIIKDIISSYKDDEEKDYTEIKQERSLTNAANATKYSNPNQLNKTSKTEKTIIKSNKENNKIIKSPISTKNTKDNLSNIENTFKTMNSQTENSSFQEDSNFSKNNSYNNTSIISENVKSNQINKFETMTRSPVNSKSNKITIEINTNSKKRSPQHSNNINYNDLFKENNEKLIPQSTKQSNSTNIIINNASSSKSPNKYIKESNIKVKHPELLVNKPQDQKDKNKTQKNPLPLATLKINLSDMLNESNDLRSYISERNLLNTSKNSYSEIENKRKESH